LSTGQIRVRDIGEFSDVPVVEVHVTPGAEVKAEDPLITLESDKASLDVPAPQAGTINEVRVKPGDRVSQGDVILLLDSKVAAGLPPKEHVKEDAAPSPRRVGESASYGPASGVFYLIDGQGAV